MGNKYDKLTESELANYRVNPRVLKNLEDLLHATPGLTPGDISVLDWGCGRGRAVAKLRQAGYNAYGVEISDETREKGFQLLNQMGLSGPDILLGLHEVDKLPPETFDLVFSDQVFEHVADLNATITAISRLTKPGGAGLHAYPGSANLWEDHIGMPLIHWFPKNSFRKSWITAMLLLGMGRRSGWPQAEGKSLRERSEIFYRYINEKTHYRDVKDIESLFHAHGMDTTHVLRLRKLVVERAPSIRPFRNGFPFGEVIVKTVKRPSKSPT